MGRILLLVFTLTLVNISTSSQINTANTNYSQEQLAELRKIAPNFNLALNKSQTWTELAENWLESGSPLKYFQVTSSQDIKALAVKFQEVAKSSKLTLPAIKSAPENQVKFLTALAPKLKGDRRFTKMYEAIASIQLKPQLNPNTSKPTNYSLGIFIFLCIFAPLSYIGFMKRSYILNKIKTLQGSSQNLSMQLDSSLLSDSLATPKWLQEWEIENIENFDSGFHPEARIPTVLDREIPEDVQTLALEAANRVLYALQVSDQHSIFLCDVVNQYVPKVSQNITYFYYDLFCQLNEKIEVYDGQKQIKKKLVGVGLSSSLLKIEFVEFDSDSSKFNPSTIELNLSSFNLSLETQLLQISSWLIFLSQELANFTTSKVTPLINSKTVNKTDSKNNKSDRKLRQKIINLQTLLQKIATSSSIESKIEKTQEFYRANTLHTSTDELIQDLIQKSREIAAINCKNWHSQNPNQSSAARQPYEYLNLDANSFDAFKYEMLKSKNIKLSLENAQSTLIGYKEFFAPAAFYQVLMKTKFDS
ncbi:hypothetical protein Syn7502_00384 [Synechococcus sp. PCC 7502]|uniref:hypothetical protein n=1 Tax=Synechococcus sp. PCC 7502 TaxID=1173263 RepID=UPI00029FC398|nr:hypothetical protein [Synechococcus sp. PCC 7502]AFY72548.1 hypothetical protein Syn7502_00384 [Synechococcus sp. PCC 7502]